LRRGYDLAANPVAKQCRSRRGALLAQNEALKEENARLRNGALQPRPPRPFGDSKSVDDALEGLLLWSEHLTEWEQGFLESLRERRGYRKELTGRQREVLCAIGAKVDGAIKVRWGRPQ
jgi:hypothetical protein